MAIVGSDSFESYPASVASISDADDAVEALKSNVELLRSQGLGAANSGEMTTVATAVKNDTIKGVYATGDSPVTGLVTDEAVVLNSAAGNVEYTTAASGYTNGHEVKLVRTSASNACTIGYNGININGAASDYTITATAYTKVTLKYWGSATGFTATEEAP